MLVFLLFLISLTYFLVNIFNNHCSQNELGERITGLVLYPIIILILMKWNYSKISPWIFSVINLYLIAV